jgi:2'-deoxynucleoside 5'-phosphate N-hydrolase
MKAYISISFSKRKFLSKELNAINEILADFKTESFVFVDNYQFDATQERQMMIQAMNDIDNCDILIAETSEKGIGIGVEVGYAKAKNKPVIYLRQFEAEHSTTVSGISDFQVIYSNTLDLKTKLTTILSNILSA